MNSVEKDLLKLLAGEVVSTVSVDLASRPQSSGAPNVDEYVPVVKRTVCYIVMALVFDDKGRVVLIQEAKESCRGSWYIPAGRVEPGENFIDAAKREVLEEAGLVFEPMTLLSLKSQLQRKWFRINFVGRARGQFYWTELIHVVNSLIYILPDGAKREVLEEAGLEIEPLTVLSIETYGSLDWYRIGYIGRVTGGKLKTLEEQDKESLQAKWFTVDEILNGFIELRHKDFFKSLRFAQQYMSQPEVSRHPSCQVGIQPHHHLLSRPVILKQSSEGNIEVLCNKKEGKTRLPCCRLHPTELSLTAALTCVYRDVFQIVKSDLSKNMWLPVKGLFTVEHCGTPAREHDGICLTPVFVLPSELNEKLRIIPNQDYVWYKITDTDLAEKLTRRVFSENLLIPLIQ